MSDNDCALLDSPPEIAGYHLEFAIGRGAYGEVWLARNALGNFFAVKIVRRGKFENARPYEREFAGIQQYEPISRSHANLVQVLHVGRDDQAGLFYYVMELADNASGAVMKRDQPRDKYSPLTLWQRLRA